MQITSISAQQKNANRVNISVDGVYRLSLDIFQLTELGLKVGSDVSDTELTHLEEESVFGKLYARALEYCLMRPHSAREVRDYLWRKTRTTKYKSRTGEVKDRPGVSQAAAERVFERLQEKGYIDDEKFARFWVENRNLTKGASHRKLEAELRAKGVPTAIIDTSMADSMRNDDEEIQKIIAKKRKRYPDEQKLMQYLARQGFSYDDIKHALSTTEY